ncbi:MAG: Hpt domain-containing protein [Lentimicrobiaceae bacterium]|jgi:HPt (histidine-containing phosphotransfer) domain-containing protein|nr:Hpt domain-containing protein [Lentimicrobiaceae bacterium]
MALYDCEKLKRYIGDDPEALKEMLILFIDSTVENMQEIKDAFEQKNMCELEKAVHKLKPTLEIYSIDTLYDPVRELEKQANQNETIENIKSNYELVMNSLNEVLDAMRKETE